MKQNGNYSTPNGDVFLSLLLFERFDTLKVMFSFISL